LVLLIQIEFGVQGARKEKVFKMELGQMLLSNTPVQTYEANWATEGLNLIAEVIAEHRGDKYGK
jgi:hypothetical protein